MLQPDCLSIAFILCQALVLVVAKAKHLEDGLRATGRLPELLKFFNLDQWHLADLALERIDFWNLSAWLLLHRLS